MLMCEACGLRLFEHALHCPRCGRAVPGAEVADDDLPSQSDNPPARFAGAPGETAAPTGGATESEDSDWDPDETSRFLPAYGSARRLRNRLALVSLTIALVAAVASLAWLIGQTVGARPVVTASAAPSPSATPPSSTPPRGSIVCTHEVARSTNTSCAVATRVLAAVRTLGTDLPDTFRVTIVDPQSRKNATYVCAIRSWIECTGSRDARIYVRRQA